MKKIYLKPEIGIAAIKNTETILAFSNQIDNANKNDDHGGKALEDGGEGSGGIDMGAKRFDLDWDFEDLTSDWDLNE